MAINNSGRIFPARRFGGRHFLLCLVLVLWLVDLAHSVWGILFPGGGGRFLTTQALLWAQSPAHTAGTAYAWSLAIILGQVLLPPLLLLGCVRGTDLVDWYKTMRLMPDSSLVEQLTGQHSGLIHRLSPLHAGAGCLLGLLGAVVLTQASGHSLDGASVSSLVPVQIVQLQATVLTMAAFSAGGTCLLMTRR